MTRFQYFVASSIDGFIATDDDQLDWLTDFDSYAGRKETYDEFLADVGAIVMGADTYRVVLAAETGTWPYGSIPTWVFTHKELPGFADADITFVRGDIDEFVPDILADAGAGNVWVLGGGQLAGQFLAAGRLDELILTIVPVLLGGGKPLLTHSSPSAGKTGTSEAPGTTTAPAELLGTRTFERGVLELRYRLSP